MLWVMVWAPKVPPGPHPLVDMDSSLIFASPVITMYPLMLGLGGLGRCGAAWLCWLVRASTRAGMHAHGRTATHARTAHKCTHAHYMYANAHTSGTTSNVTLSHLRSKKKIVLQM